MSPNGSSAARLATILVLVGLAGPIIASTGPERSASSDVMAVQRFLADSYHFDSAITRKRALAWGIKPVPQWPFLNRLQHHRLYSFPTSKGSPFTFDVVSVSDKGEVALLGGPEAFSKLLETEGLRASSPSEIIEMARAFLRIERFSAYKTEGLDLGIAVLLSVDDIPFPESSAGLRQRAEVASKFNIRPPTLGENGENFSYVLYGWVSEGGALMRCEVVLRADQVIDYNVEVLTQWIGRYDAVH